MEVKLIKRKGYILAFVISFIIFVIIIVYDIVTSSFKWEKVFDNFVVAFFVFWICKAIYNAGVRNSENYYFRNGFQTGFTVAIIELMKDNENEKEKPAETNPFKEEVLDGMSNVNTKESEEYN